MNTFFDSATGIRTQELKAPQGGDIVFSHRRKGIYPWLVKYFTGGPSHCFFLAGEVLEYLCAYESDLKCQLVPWAKEYGEKEVDNYEVWRPIAASPDFVKFASKKTFFDFAGMSYGFAQLLYWPWKAIRKALGFKHPFRNSFPAGAICSELLMVYFQNLGPQYAALVKDFDVDEVSPQDLRETVLAHPELFEYIAARDLGEGAWRPEFK